MQQPLRNLCAWGENRNSRKGITIIYQLVNNYICTIKQLTTYLSQQLRLIVCATNSTFEIQYFNTQNMKKWKILNDSDKGSQSSIANHNQTMEGFEPTKQFNKKYNPLRRSKDNLPNAGTDTKQTNAANPVFSPYFSQKYIKWDSNSSMGRPRSRERSRELKMKTQQQSQDQFVLGDRLKTLEDIQQMNHFNLSRQSERQSFPNKAEGMNMHKLMSQRQTQRVFIKKRDSISSHLKQTPRQFIQASRTNYLQQQSIAIMLKDCVKSLKNCQSQLKSNVAEQINTYRKMFDAQKTEINKKLIEKTASKQYQKVVDSIFRSYQQKYRPRIQELEQHKQQLLHQLIKMAPV